MQITLVQQMDYIDNCVIRFQSGDLEAISAIERIKNMVSLVPKLKQHGKLAINDIRKELNKTTRNH